MSSFFLVVVGYLHVLSIALRPPEADSPLVVDSDAVLALSIPSQSLKAIAWRDSKILECVGAIENGQLSLRLPLKRRREFPGDLTPKDFLRFRVPEAPDHLGMIT
jgi:hypothetical protein